MRSILGSEAFLYEEVPQVEDHNQKQEREQARQLLHDFEEQMERELYEQDDLESLSSNSWKEEPN